MENKTETPTLALTPEEKIKDGLASSNLAEAAIEQLKEDYKDLKVKDINDLVGYEAVRKARITVQKVRIGIEKYCDAAGRGAYDYYKACAVEKKRYLALISPLEEKLQHEEEFIDREKEKIKLDTEQKELLRKQTRIKRLVALGMIFNGEDVYTISDSETSQRLDTATIVHASDEQFEKYVTIVHSISQSIEAEKKAIQDQIDATAKEQKAEALRLEGIAEENRKKEQALLAKEKELLKAEQERADKILAQRLQRLQDIGFTYQGLKSLAFHGWVILTDEISKTEDADFDKYIEEAKAHGKKAEADREAKRQAEIEAAQKRAIIDRQIKEKADAELAKKREMRRSDKIRLLACANFDTVSFPEGLKSEEANKIIAEAKKRLSAISTYIVTETNNL